MPTRPYSLLPTRRTFAFAAISVTFAFAGVLVTLPATFAYASWGRALQARFAFAGVGMTASGKSKGSKGSVGCGGDAKQL